ncbi:MAG: helix-hairpin-helix domain-containing protein [Acidobacteria bacterium]|nr:helix-hairpin-helix domain-containing protein [Acidobacteriota bacterium]
MFLGEGWSRRLAGGLLLASAWAGVDASESGKIDYQALLPDGPGKVQVATYCAMCHDLKYVVFGNRNKEQWLGIIDAMISDFKAPIPDDEAEGLSAYLAAHCGPANPIREMPMDLNRVGGRELSRLPGLKAEQIQAILRHREEGGPFSGVEELEALIGKSTFLKIKPYLYVRDPASISKSSP